jgi:aldehyde dehydrogenase (NAD+)
MKIHDGLFASKIILCLRWQSEFVLYQKTEVALHIIYFGNAPLNYKLFIDGSWEDSESGETYSRVNPADPDEILGEFQKGNAEDAKKAIEAAKDHSDEWSQIPAPKRAQYVMKAAELLVSYKEDLSQIVTREMGKTLHDSRGEVQQAIDIAYYAAGEGRRFLGHTIPSEETTRMTFTMRLPIGTVVLITPWNFPIMIPARKLFYSLVCGNTVVFKPSSEAPMCACKLLEILEKTGIPRGVVNLVTGPGGVVGDTLVTDKRVGLVSFCGHKDTGAQIMRQSSPKRVSLELGGKNPLIIMDDADLYLAVIGAIWGGYQTTGQRCTAASRVIVHEKVKSKVEKIFIEEIKKLKLGNGLDPETDIGPLVNKKAQDKMKEYCQIGDGEGSKLLFGGQVPSNLKGWYFEPTLFTDCMSDMQICQKEIFGPIVSILPAKNLEHAIDIANSVDYGLSSAIYTNNIGSAFTAIKKLQAGLTYVNHPTIGSEAHLPFGGIKFSGNNRESGPEGVGEFSELKTVYFNYLNSENLSYPKGQAPGHSSYSTP